MKRTILALVVAGAAVAGCQQRGGNVQTTIRDASNDIGNFAADAGDRIENVAANAGDAIENGAAATANRAREVVNDIADGPDRNRSATTNTSTNASTNKSGR